MLARSLTAQLKLPSPTPGRSPDDKLRDGRPTTYVKLFTWFHVPDDEYSARSLRAAVGPVWAEATATPAVLTFDPGDGGPMVRCSGPGRPWDKYRDTNFDRAPGGCDYRYLRASRGFPQGMVTATYGIEWAITWRGSGGTGGALPPVTTTTQSRFAVAEAQAVVVAP